LHWIHHQFHHPIQESALHIYISAQPFSPKDSLVAKQYRPHFLNTLHVMSEHDYSWAAGINVLRGHIGAVWSVTFSSDDKLIVSGSPVNSICVWDDKTGEMVSGPFKGHTQSVLSVTFSCDGNRIVSGSSDKSIHIWDAKPGEMVCGSFAGHAEAVLSVAFSSDRKWITSGS
jgi:WD40 repeat protein